MLPPLRFLAVRFGLCLALASGLAAAPILKNISTRLKVETGDSVAIAGFVVQGAGQKRVLVRGKGPSLAQAGITNALTNPFLQLNDATGAAIATNDNWRQTQEADITASGLAPGNDNESALIATLDPGNYTVFLRGADGGTGVGLVEVFDLDQTVTATAINISTRGIVRTGNDVMIGGFVIGGTGSKRVLVRAIGPALAPYGVPNVLADPNVELVNAAGQRVALNDDWRATQEADIVASGFAPTNDKESAILATLEPGAYTAIVRGAGSSTGNALIEVYDLAPTTPAPPADQLYLSTLRAAPGATTGASGSAALSLAADLTSIVVSVSYSNLSSLTTSAHLEDRNGVNLFDLNPRTLRPDGTWLWTLEPVGPYSIDQLIELLRSGQIVVRVYTVNFPNGELVGGFTQANGSRVFTPPAPPPPAPITPADDNDAVRFLAQATFGPTEAEIARVRSRGYAGWLDDQFAAAPSFLLPYVDANYDPNATTPNPSSPAWSYYGWWKNAVQAPDQLRQRTAWALAQILVVSTDSQGINNNPYAIAAYYDVLLKDAFGNFRTLLEDITLNPGMGLFLDMLGNNKGNVTTGTNPNENYAREILQLFSIGLFQVYPDNTLKLDARGFPISTYGQEAITGFARVFTGWNFGTASQVNGARLRTPMAVNANQHEPGSKLLLDGYTIPATTGAVTAATANNDLRLALDNIFNHPNVGPFLAYRLIQRLVTSNPSPGYIYRVARTFENNGAGVRGDLRAVVRAILTDYEARSNALIGFQAAGKLREPVLRVTHLLRLHGATSPTGVFRLAVLDNELGQTPLRPATVFNFYTPDYAAPGAITSAGVVGPEFEITTATTSITVSNYLRTVIFTGAGPGTDRITLTLDPALLSQATNNANIPALIDRLNTLYCAGQLNAAARSALIDAVTAITPASDGTTKVRSALQLIVTSPQFAVQR
ncbi:MAG: DUF1800 family protein [Verrucomicrobia bacterium]|nr:DUF1800 family protein [Verrucomicrobiota bacterium]